MAERPDEVRERSHQEEGPPESTPAASEELKERARGDEVAATRAEVEQTRAEMGETIDALQEKLEPRNLKEQVMEQASSVARGTASELLEAVRNNPARAAIAGATLLGLMLLTRVLQGRGRRGATAVVIDLRKGEVRRA